MTLFPDTSVASAGTIRLGDLTVNRMGFGAMRLCGPLAWGMRRDRGNAHRVLHRALELGVNFIDTADSYGPAANETLIAEALYPYPRGLVIATKGGLVRPNRWSWVEDGRPEHLRRAGKIRHLGISNVTIAQLDEARRIATIVSVQNEYNVRNRSCEDVLAACESLGIAFLPWFPLGGKSCIRAFKIKRVAARRGVAPAQVALAWLLAHSRVMLPIPGTQSIGHLEENVRAAALILAPEDFGDLG